MRCIKQAWPMVSRYMVAVLIIIVINYLNSVIFPIQLFLGGGYFVVACEEG